MEYDFFIKESFLFCNCILHTIIVTKSLTLLTVKIFPENIDLFPNYLEIVF
jgi:hypothetical protein